MKPASSSSGVGLNQHPLRTLRVPDNVENRAQNPLPEESGGPSQKIKGAQSKRVHITGQVTVVLTEDNRNRKSSRAPALLV
jgi:hypothetical protein